VTRTSLTRTRRTGRPRNGRDRVALWPFDRVALWPFGCVLHVPLERGGLAHGG
jgi:hypothetical protein